LLGLTPGAPGSEAEDQGEHAGLVQLLAQEDETEDDEPALRAANPEDAGGERQGDHAATETAHESEGHGLDETVHELAYTPRGRDGGEEQQKPGQDHADGRLVDAHGVPPFDRSHP
jgi:hypothetical protein